MPRLDHADAQTGDTVPHMRQLAIAFQDNLVIVDGRTLVPGWATGRSNNCLIDTLRQQLHYTASLDAVRSALQLRYTAGPAHVKGNNYLDLDLHGLAVVDLLHQYATNISVPREPIAHTVTIKCIDLTFRGNGDVIGTGRRTLYIARQSANHFVPLLPWHGVVVQQPDASAAMQR
jgi:hypothetical protein